MAQPPDPLDNVSLFWLLNINLYADVLKGSASSDRFIESLDRLSKKNGVLATIVLDRSSGAILNSSGTLSSIRSTSGPSQSVSATVSDDSASGPKDQNGVDEMAVMVWNYTNATKDLVQGLDMQVKSFSYGSMNTFNSDYRMRLSCCVYEPKSTSS